MNVFLRRLWEQFTWRTVMVGLAATVVATVAGPFGTYVGMSFGERRLYWALVIAVSIVIGIMIRVAVAIWLPQLGRNAQDILVPVVFAALFTAILDHINHTIFGFPTNSGPDYLETFVFVLAVAGFVGLFRRAIMNEPTVAVVAVTPATEIAIGAGLTDGTTVLAPSAPNPSDTASLLPESSILLSSAIESPVLSPPMPVPVPIPPPVLASSPTAPPLTMPPVSRRPRLLDRIEGADAASVVRLTVDDHYVIVFLDDGTTHRLLMRFADAVAEMAGQDGLLSHRSHWVALSAIAGITRSKGREMVRLADGSLVPISRSCRPGFVARGFLTLPAPTQSGTAE